MLAWWAWLLIWSGLALALVAVLALGAWWLFRKSLTVLDDLADLADTAEILGVDEAELPAPTIAVLADLREIRAREDARRAHRARRRSDRRRRRLVRARAITSVDASRRRWPAEWY